MISIAKLTREEIVERALAIFDKCGYIWGGYPGTETPCGPGENGYGTTDASGYIATDCSGYVSWAWGLGGHAHSSSWGPKGTYGGGHYSERADYSGNAETDFPGIKLGDVLWKDGHVGIYIGGGVILHAWTNHWSVTNTGHGMQRDTYARSEWEGFTSYDETFSSDYDPDTDPPLDEWTPPTQFEWPGGVPEYDDGERFWQMAYLHDRYTRKYIKMKNWRKFK